MRTGVEASETTSYVAVGRISPFFDLPLTSDFDLALELDVPHGGDVEEDPESIPPMNIESS